MSSTVKTSKRALYAQVGLGVVAVVLASLVTMDLAKSPTVKARLAAAHLLPQPDRFTALSFGDQTLLPFMATGKAQPFTFDVANHEGQTMSYRYAVMTVGANGTTTKLASGTLLATDGQTAELTEAVDLPVGAPRTEVLVELPDLGQEIHFWIGGQS